MFWGGIKTVRSAQKAFKLTIKILQYIAILFWILQYIAIRFSGHNTQPY